MLPFPPVFFLTPSCFFLDAYILLFIIFIDLLILEYTFINITKHLKYINNNSFIYFNTGMIYIVRFLPPKLPPKLRNIENVLFPFIFFWFFFNLLFYRYIHIIRNNIYLIIMQYDFLFEFYISFFINYGFSR